jgi:hypothetical protein
MSSPFVDSERLLFKNKIHSILTNFSAYFQEEFEKTDIKKCEKCNGMGDISPGCKKCGRVIMCECDGSLHPYGMGCL